MARIMKPNSNQDKYGIMVSVKNMRTNKFKVTSTRYIGTRDIEEKILESFLPKLQNIESKGRANASNKSGREQ